MRAAASLPPDFFELQIKTLFQHAWSEAEHDLAISHLRRCRISRREKWRSAAQAWGADQIFAKLFDELEGKE